MSGSIVLAMAAMTLLLSAAMLLLLLDAKSRLVAQRTQTAVRPYPQAAPTAGFRAGESAGAYHRRVRLDRLAGLRFLRRAVDVQAVQRALRAGALPADAGRTLDDRPIGARRSSGDGSL